MAFAALAMAEAESARLRAVLAQIAAAFDPDPVPLDNIIRVAHLARQALAEGHDAST